MHARLLVLSVFVFGCTAADRPADRPVTEAKQEAPAKQESPGKQDEVAEPMPTTATPPPVTPPASDEPVVSWWCACYYKRGEGEPERMTACRATEQDCRSLEKAVTAGRSGIVPRSLTHACQETKAAHPGDPYGGRDAWEPSKKAGSWLSVGACRLPGEGEQVDPYAQTKEAENILSTERLGELRLGMKAVEAVALLGEPTKKGRNEPWEADGLRHQDWSWPGLGVTLDMQASSRKGEQSVGSITAVAPCAFKTLKGIGIGSPRAEAMKQYGKLKDPMYSDDLEHHLIAGSVYGGVMFDFEKGRVTKIFFGAAAE